MSTSGTEMWGQLGQAPGPAAVFSVWGLVAAVVGSLCVAKPAKGGKLTWLLLTPRVGIHLS